MNKSSALQLLQQYKPKFEQVNLSADPALTWLPLSYITAVREFMRTHPRYKVYAFYTLQDGVTDPLNIGHGTRVFSVKERIRLAATLTDKPVNINHWPLLKNSLPLPNTQVFDAEFDNKTGAIVGLIVSEDNVLHELYQQGKVIGPSLEFSARDDPCAAKGIDEQCPVGTIATGIGIITTDSGEWTGDLRAKLALAENCGCGKESAHECPADMTWDETKGECVPVQTEQQGNGEQPPDEDWFVACKKRAAQFSDNPFAFCTWLWNRSDSTQRSVLGESLYDFYSKAYLQALQLGVGNTTALAFDAFDTVAEYVCSSGAFTRTEYEQALSRLSKLSIAERLVVLYSRADDVLQGVDTIKERNKMEEKELAIIREFVANQITEQLTKVLPATLTEQLANHKCGCGESVAALAKALTEITGRVDALSKQTETAVARGDKIVENVAAMLNKPAQVQQPTVRSQLRREQLGAYFERLGLDK